MSEGVVIWLTGLPSAGKSTLAKRAIAAFQEAGWPCCVLDGDAVRSALAPTPGYDEKARDDFYLSLAQLAALLARQGLVVVVAATAHLRRYRQRARELAPFYLEVHVDVPLAACLKRDAKGLYAAAAPKGASLLPGCGVTYEAPQNPDVVASGGRDDAAINLLVTALVTQRSA